MEFTAITALVGVRRGKSSFWFLPRLLEQSCEGLLPPPRSRRCNFLLADQNKALATNPMICSKGTMVRASGMAGSIMITAVATTVFLLKGI